MNHEMDWPYLRLQNGRIIDEGGNHQMKNAPVFANMDQANDWLEMTGERGTVSEEIN